MWGLEVSLCGKHSSFMSVWAHCGKVALTKSKVMRGEFPLMQRGLLEKLGRTTACRTNFLTDHEYWADEMHSENKNMRHFHFNLRQCSFCWLHSFFPPECNYIIVLKAETQTEQEHYLYAKSTNILELIYSHVDSTPGTEIGVYITMKMLATYLLKAKSLSSSVLFKDSTPVWTSMWNQELWAGWTVRHR